MKTFSFSRNEHLKNKKTIDLLFKEGKSVKTYPIKFQFIVHNEDTKHNLHNNMEVAFVVPKRSFKKAVERNRIKRQMHECFRLNREELIVDLKRNKLVLSVMIIFIGNKFAEYSSIEKNVKKGLMSLREKQLTNAD